MILNQYVVILASCFSFVKDRGNDLHAKHVNIYIVFCTQMHTTMCICVCVKPDSCKWACQHFTFSTFTKL